MAGLDTPDPVRSVPGPLALVRDFVNTTDHETGTDDLSSPAELSTYLQHAGLLGRTVRASGDDLTLARQLRAGLRRSLELNHDGSSGAIPELDAALTKLPLRLRWEGDRSTLVPVGSGVSGALSQIAVAMSQAVAEGNWWRLKICADDECEWAYYDGSKNRARNWCEYGCGNRAKVRAYRQRRRASAGSSQQRQ